MPVRSLMHADEEEEILESKRARRRSGVLLAIGAVAVLGLGATIGWFLFR